MAEISGQPASMRRAAAGLKAQLGSLNEMASPGIPPVVFTGMGSSYDACYPAVADLAEAGIPAMMIDSSELLHFRMNSIGPGSLVIAVSQSGESAEVVRLGQALADRPDRPRIASVTNGLDSSLARLADIALDTSAGEETGPSTMTFAASLVVLAAVARTLRGDRAETTVEQIEIKAEGAARASEALLADEALADRLVGLFHNAIAAVILGRGPARAAAEMGALTIKEAAALPVESLQAAQFRHGPLELAGPGLSALILATEAATEDLDLNLARQLVDSGCSVAIVTMERRTLPGAIEVAIGSLDPCLAPAVSIVPSQLIAWRLATEKGREPGSYYRASKVTLDE
jgi:glutamine---fructose-6-phosphate transaminase (isomerizing)